MAGAAYVACGGAPRTLVEIGSYQGRSTVVLGSTLRALSPQSRLFALDPHEGTVGAADAQLYHGASTEERFLANILAAGLTEQIHPVRARSYEVSWPEVAKIDRSTSCSWTGCTTASTWNATSAASRLSWREKPSCSFMITATVSGCPRLRGRAGRA